uniref:Uncharacterized protein n=1 Tax=Anopheles melas TaxID=34690 RepID=A0A182TKX3_9DIPT
KKKSNKNNLVLNQNYRYYTQPGKPANPVESIPLMTVEKIGGVGGGPASKTGPSKLGLNAKIAPVASKSPINKTNMATGKPVTTSLITAVNSTTPKARVLSASSATAGPSGLGRAGSGSGGSSRGGDSGVGMGCSSTSSLATSASGSKQDEKYDNKKNETIEKKKKEEKAKQKAEKEARKEEKRIAKEEEKLAKMLAKEEKKRGKREAKEALLAHEGGNGLK